jgi:hypothetical protein
MHRLIAAVTGLSLAGCTIIDPHISLPRPDPTAKPNNVEYAGGMGPVIDQADRLSSTLGILRGEAKSLDESFYEPDGHFDGVGGLPGHG